MLMYNLHLQGTCAICSTDWIDWMLATSESNRKEKFENRKPERGNHYPE